MVNKKEELIYIYLHYHSIIISYLHNFWNSKDESHIYLLMW